MKQVTALLIAVLLCYGVQSQLLKDGLKKVSNKLEKNPVSEILKKPAPITTSLEDAKWEADSLDSFNPSEEAKGLESLERTENGGFKLKEGYFNMQTQSYCLKAGTHGPGGGDGYLYAPTAGPMDEIVTSIVRNSVSKPGLAQQDIQQLLWSIIARAKFEDLDIKIKAVAAQLLTPRQLAAINRNLLDMAQDKALEKALSEAPPQLRTVLEAEAKLRQMLTDPASTFADLERVAVLSGMAPLGEGSRNVPSGRWSLHPDGYYVRYIPSSYSSTRVEIWVPQGSPAVGKEYDPATHIAVPGNTSRQRLIQSGRKKES